MPVGEICTREVVITEKSSTIQSVAQLMRQYHVGDIVVIEHRSQGRVPLGIITDRDIVVELVAEGVNLDTVTVGDVMSFELATVREQDGIWETLQYMRGRGVRRAPVVDSEGALVGIVSADDMLELLAEELGALSGIVRREQMRENKSRR